MLRIVLFKENFRYKIIFDNFGYRGIYEMCGGIYKF